MKKRIVSSIMCLAMLLSLLPVSAFAAEGDGIGTTVTADPSTVTAAVSGDATDGYTVTLGGELAAPESGTTTDVALTFSVTTNGSTESKTADVTLTYVEADPDATPATTASWTLPTDKLTVGEYEVTVAGSVAVAEPAADGIAEDVTANPSTVTAAVSGDATDGYTVTLGGKLAAPASGTTTTDVTLTFSVTKDGSTESKTADVTLTYVEADPDATPATPASWTLPTDKLTVGDYQVTVAGSVAVEEPAADGIAEDVTANPSTVTAAVSGDATNGYTVTLGGKLAAPASGTTADVTLTFSVTKNGSTESKTADVTLTYVEADPDATPATPASWTLPTDKLTVGDYQVTVAGSVAVADASAAAQHTVTITEPTNGTLTVKVGENEVTETNNQFDKDSVVTITAVPNAGYELTKITVDSTALEPKDGVYSVTLTKDITIAAEFQAIEYTLTIDETKVDINGVSTGGTITVKIGEETAVSDLTGLKATVADTIVVTVTAPEKYIANVSGVAGAAQADTDVGSAKQTTYTFKMPAADTTVKVAYEPLGAYNITIEETDSHGTVTVLKTADEGNVVDIAIEAETGYKVSGVTVKEKTNSTAVSVTEVKDADGNVTGYTFTMPADDVIVTVTYAQVPYAITIADYEDGHAVTITGNLETAIAGNTVSFTAEPKAGYKIGSVTVTYTGGTCEYTEDAGTYSFTMPAADVTITVNFVEKASIVSVTTGTLPADVYVTAEMKDGEVVFGGYITVAAGATGTKTYEVPLIFTDSEGTAIPVTATLTLDCDTATPTLTCAAMTVTVDGVAQTVQAKTSDVTITPVTVEIAAPTPDMDDLDTEATPEQQEALETALATTTIKDVAATPEVAAIITSDAVAALVADENVTDVKVEISLEIAALEYTPAQSLKIDITPTYKVTYKESAVEKDGPTGTISQFEEPQLVEITLPTGFTAKTALHYTNNVVDQRIPVTMEGQKATFLATKFSPYELTAAAQTLTIKYHEGETVTDVTYDLDDLTNAKLKASDNGWATSSGGSKVYESEQPLTVELFNTLYGTTGEVDLYAVTSTDDGSGDGNGSGGSSGGGGGGGSVSSNVTVSSASNGKVTVTPTAPSKGATVTINLTPDSGYQVGSVTVTDKDGNAVELTKVSDTQYTFTMPDGKVTVNATFTQTEAPSATGFTDVTADAYYADAVKWAVEQGITNGLTSTTFGPEHSCTRGQMVTFLWRAAGSPAAAGTNSFSDVASGEYYYDAVLWAVEQGITNGTSDTTFSPNATVTRGQTVTFLYRYAGSPAVSGDSSFTDVASSDFYASAVAWAVAEEITNGTSTTTFSPASNCTRGQIVTFMYRQMAE